MVKFSIIVPVYNAEKTLERCVQSIQAQTYTDWELLLIDDGSTDASGTMCDSYALDMLYNIKAFHTQNGGASAARNVGLVHAQGEWITFCDSDDWVDDNWLKLFVKQMDGKADFLAQGVVYHKNGGLSVNGINYYGSMKEGLLCLRKEWLSGFLYLKALKRSIIERYILRFDPKLKLREDEMFVFEYLEHTSCVSSIDEGAYHYVVPDYDTKYAHVDQFYMFLKIYAVLKRIFPDENNWLCRDYLIDLTRSLFYSFTVEAYDRKQKVKYYRREVGKKVLSMTSVSFFSRCVLAYIPFNLTVYWLLESKLKLAKWIKT